MPSTAPRVSLEEDELVGSPRISDTVDRGLVEIRDKLVIHVMVFIVGVEDDLLVVLEACRHGLPPGLEVGDVRDDIAVVASEVVGVENGVGAPAKC